MKETKIFLLAGKARTGKDTVATEIVKYYQNKHKKVVRLGFSDYIKNYAMKITDWDGKDETKPRDLLQTLGTDIVRDKINKDFFINRLCEDIMVYSYFFDVIVISGARFANELDIPKSKFKNVTIIKMERPNNENNLTEKQKKHITEHALENYHNYDYLIVNDSDEEKLKEKVNVLLEEVENGR